MTLVDRTNEEIELSLERPVGFVLKLDIDRDSSVHTEPYLWLEVAHEFYDDVESQAWRMTLEEAGRAHDRLGLILGRPVNTAVTESDVRALVDVYQEEWEEYQRVWRSLPTETAQEMLDSQFRFRPARRLLLDGYRKVGAE